MIRPILQNPTQNQASKSLLTLLVSLIFLLNYGCATKITNPDLPFAASANNEGQADTTSKKKTTQNFEAETTYSLLLGELAGLRNQYPIALQAYVQQARKTQDAGIAERAARMAIYLNAGPYSEEMATLWAKLAPNNSEAQQTAALQLAKSGKLEEGLLLMQDILKNNGEARFDFLALYAKPLSGEARAKLIKAFEKTQTKHPTYPHLLFGLALLYNQSQNYDQALQYTEAFLDVLDNDNGRVLKGQILQAQGKADAALTYVKKSLKAHPSSRRLRLQWARLLVNNGSTVEAAKAFESLLASAPNDKDLVLSVALLALENELFDTAKSYLKHLIKHANGPQDTHAQAALMHLGQLAEKQNDPQQAIDYYHRVSFGQHYLSAKVRKAQLIMAHHGAATLRAYIAELGRENAKIADRLALLESELLAPEHPQLAVQALTEFLIDAPQNKDILYARAMLFEQQGKLTSAKKDFEQILKRHPNDTATLNALGYSLADQNQELNYALSLIEKAYSLNSEDPAIIDSLGWVKYRLGQLSEAKAHLKHAFEMMPDAEIGAHFGEVLWQLGEHNDAKQVWLRSQLKQSDNQTLQKTLKKFGVSPKDLLSLIPEDAPPALSVPAQTDQSTMQLDKKVGN